MSTQTDTYVPSAYYILKARSCFETATDSNRKICQFWTQKYNVTATGENWANKAPISKKKSGIFNTKSKNFEHERLSDWFLILIRVFLSNFCIIQNSLNVPLSYVEMSYQFECNYADSDLYCIVNGKAYISLYSTAKRNWQRSNGHFSLFVLLRDFSTTYLLLWKPPHQRNEKRKRKPHRPIQCCAIKNAAQAIRKRENCE